MPRQAYSKVGPITFGDKYQTPTIELIPKQKSIEPTNAILGTVLSFGIDIEIKAYTDINTVMTETNGYFTPL